ncbi:trypsin-like peptidase domain-containing protein [Leisingera caerulea]|uniref:trypsin-like peptidase domain-containing protein n=1 Tax=Leisingera caerulea TaxID=506591 RepID=UPI0003F9E970|nr:trypsin-like peptidase domain-containing protein [Leisingera caerulea]
MPVKLHARSIDAGRMALLGLAISTSVAQADPFEAAVPVLTDAARAALSGEIAQTIQDAVVATHKAMPAGEDRAADGHAADPASVFLMAWYDNGTVRSGTGTIISHQDGDAKVLTAGHVTRIWDPSGGELVEILAYSHSGQALAVLQPELIGHEGIDGSSMTVESLAMDVAVLTPVHYATPEVKASWNSWGREIAPVQPGELMMVTAGHATQLLNQGASGSAILDGEGRVVGVLNAAYHLSDAEIGPGGSEFLERAAARTDADGDPFDVGTSFEDAKTIVSEENRAARMKGGLGIATPIVQTDLLQALGAGDVSIREQDHAFYGAVSGYPDSELRSETVTVTSLPNYPVSASFDPQVVQMFSYDAAADPAGPAT